LAPYNGYTPLSTLIPGTIPFLIKISINFSPVEATSLAVSSNKITPEIYFSISGVVNNNSL